MKFILFCNLPYAFSILKPLEQEIKSRGFKSLWYVPSELIDSFPYKTSQYTSKTADLKSFQSDIIYVAGNDVPHFLTGLKVQVFHGLAGEKKGHFRIRDYFDLYLTQGPYFTGKFKELAKKYKNFDVIETGWCKLDNLHSYNKKENIEKTILYSPTFSPSLTSSRELLRTIKELSEKYKVVVKFHDKMDQEIIELYKNEDLIISNEKDITPLMQTSDLMISDTSSVVYEFTLLNKPVVTLNSASENINWENVSNSDMLKIKVIEILDGNDMYKDKRKNIIANYHPYNDGKSSKRMVDAVEDYICKKGVPLKRRLPLLRKLKIWKKFGIL